MIKNISDEDLSLIISHSIASSKIRNIALPEGVEIRGQIHICLYGRIGSGKSTILKQIAQITNQTNYPSLSKAVLLGTADKTTGSITLPAVWEQRNSVLLIDEFYITKNDYSEKNMLNTLLSLLETNPQYKKPIGYRCDEFKKKDKDLFIKIKNNQIECKTRFTLILNTMMELHKTQMQSVKALMTRCITIPYYPSKSELYDRLVGKKPFFYQEITPKCNIVTSKIIKKISDFMQKKEIKEENILRLAGDLYRFYYISGWNDDLFNSICDLTQS